MHLLRLSEVEIGVNDRVFRHARLRALLLWLAAFCGDAAMFFSAVTGKWKPGYIFGPALLLFLLLVLRFVTPRFHPSNWLVRANETGLFAQYRSYLNYQLPADEPSVVFHLLRRDRGGASHPRACADARSGAPWRHSNAIPEIHRTGIGRRHRVARERPAAREVREAFDEEALVRQRIDAVPGLSAHNGHAAVLRIRWDVVPRAARFLAYLLQYTRIADPVSLKQDFTRLQSLSHEEQQKTVARPRCPRRGHRRHLHCAETVRLQHAAGEDDGGQANRRAAAHVTPRPSLLVLFLVVATACTSERSFMDSNKLNDFAARYTAAWCSQNAASVASFFGEKGSLKINDGAPAVGRAAITDAAQSFMTAFPDLVIKMDSVNMSGADITYHWTLTGTNTGPGGTGKFVRISGFEQWRFGPNGLVTESKGHFDAAEYQRQLIAGAKSS